MECKVNYAQLIASPSPFLLSQRSVTSNGKHVIRVHKQINVKEKLIEIIQILAVILLTGGIALFFSRFRTHCTQILFKEKNLYVYWDSLPENEVLKRVQKNGLELKFAPPRMQENRTIVLAAVNQNGTALRFASPSLRSDVEITQAAVRQSQGAKAFVIPPKIVEVPPIPKTESLIEETKANPAVIINPIEDKPKKDPEPPPVVIPEVKKEETAPPALPPPPQEIKREVIPQEPKPAFSEKDVEAVLKKGNYFPEPIINEPLKSNRDFFLRLVAENGALLRLGSETIKKDKEIIQKAIEIMPWTLIFAIIQFPDDIDFCFQLLEKKFWYLNSFSSSVFDNEEFVEKLVKKYGASKLIEGAEALRKKDNFMRQYPHHYHSASDTLKADFEYACQAFQFYSFGRLSPKAQVKIQQLVNKIKSKTNIHDPNFFDCDVKLLKIENFLQLALEANPLVYDTGPLVHLRRSIPFMAEAVYRNPKLLTVMIELKNNKDFWLAALQRSPALFRNEEEECVVPPPLHIDRLILLEAAKDAKNIDIIEDEIEDIDVLAALMKMDQEAFLKGHSKLRNNSNHIVELVRKVPSDPTFLNFLSPAQKSDEYLFSRLREANPKALNYATNATQQKVIQWK